MSWSGFLLKKTRTFLSEETGMQHFWLGTGLLMAALGRAKNIGQRALTWMYHYIKYFFLLPTWIYQYIETSINTCSSVFRRWNHSISVWFGVI